MPWAVCVTQPNRESVALRHATRQGFECWLPRLSHSEVLFPRYVFVQIVSAWRNLLSTIGITDVLRNGDAPSFVRTDEMTRLMAREHNGVILLPRDRFLPGELVHVNRGPLAGFDVIYQGMARRDRCRVLHDMLGCKTEIEIAENVLSSI